MKTACVFESQPRTSPPVQMLKADEEQALCYVAGYVPMKLKKYEKQPNNAHAVKYMECLNVMTEEKGEDVEFCNALNFGSNK